MEISSVENDLNLASWRLEVAERVVEALHKRIEHLEHKGGDVAAARILLVKCQHLRWLHLEQYVRLRKMLIDCEKG